MTSPVQVKYPMLARAASEAEAVEVLMISWRGKGEGCEGGCGFEGSGGWREAMIEDEQLRN